MLILPLLCPVPASAWGLKLQEWGGGAYVSRDFNLKNNTLDSTGVLGYMTTPFWDSAYLKLEGRLEAQLGGYWDYSTGVELALLPSLRLYLHSPQAPGMAIYGEAGVGPSYNTLNIKELGEGFNFISFWGLGLRLPLSKFTSLDLGYRMRHISNAGLDDANGGVNSHVLLLELGFQY
jgi:hypothetical protein